MEKRTNRISIFDYTDYRKYLFDFYHEQKIIRKAFSYRFFARKAGINSVGLYKDVIEGRQSLGRSLIFKFSSAIGHSKKESEYFENMVYFNEAKSAEERTLFFERMMACHRSKAKIVDSTKYEYYRKWYYSAIRALISCTKIGSDTVSYATIAKTLNPHIRPDQVEKGITVLEKLGFIKKESDGFYALCDTVISSGIVKMEENIASLNLVNYQKEMMKLAGSAFDRYNSEQLSMSTLTVTISEKTLGKIKEELTGVRNKIASLADLDSDADRVFQINIQLFPMSGAYKEASHD